MNFAKKLIGNEEERAVSPVIGVILMVAITVILAAVIAAFVMDIGPGDSAQPTVQFNHDLNEAGDTVTITHAGGDNFDSANVRVGDEDWDDGTISVGDHEDFSCTGDEVHIVWDSGNGGQILDTVSCE